MLKKATTHVSSKIINSLVQATQDLIKIFSNHAGFLVEIAFNPNT